MFPDKQKLREFVTTGPALREMLMGVLQGEMKGHQHLKALGKNRDLSQGNTWAITNAYVTVAMAGDSTFRFKYLTRSGWNSSAVVIYLAVCASRVLRGC